MLETNIVLDSDTMSGKEIPALVLKTHVGDLSKYKGTVLINNSVYDVVHFLDGTYQVWKTSKPVTDISQLIKGK